MRWCLALATLMTITPWPGAAIHAQELWPWEKEEPRPKRIDVSLGPGLQLSTNWSDLVVLGTLGGLVENVLVRNVAFAPGHSMGLTVTYWEGRFGFRVNAAVARSCLAVGGGCGSFVIPNDDTTNDDERIVVRRIDANAYSLDVGGAIAFVAPGADVPFRPFFFFGAGGLSYDLDDAVRFLLPSFIELGGIPGRIGLDRDGRVKVITDGSPFLVSVDQPGFELLFAGILGLGVDLRVPLGQAALGVRFEMADHVTRSPLEVRLAGFVDDFRFSRTDIEDVRFDFGLVHNLQLSVGLVLNAPLHHATPPTRSSGAARH
jgi:hypothetical protein